MQKRALRVALHLVAPFSFAVASATYLSSVDLSYSTFGYLDLALFGPLQSPFGFLLSAVFYLTLVAATVLPNTFTIFSFFVAGLPSWYLGVRFALGFSGN